MSTPYESNFYKVAALSDLATDQPRVFRAGGATIVLRRDGDGVTAIDGSCLAEESEAPANARVQRILDCVAGGGANDWSALLKRAGLAVRIDGSDVWVCIDGCKS